MMSVAAISMLTLWRDGIGCEAAPTDGGKASRTRPSKRSPERRPDRAHALPRFADERRPWSRQRHAVITANPGLLERELLKRASLAAVVAGALRARGVAERAAVLAAETGVTVFSVAFSKWIAEDEQRSLAEIEREVLEELKALAA
jgi:hypothetical protein